MKLTRAMDIFTLKKRRVPRKQGSCELIDLNVATSNGIHNIVNMQNFKLLPFLLLKI